MATQGIEQPHVQRPRGKTSGGRKPADASPLTAYLFMAPYLVLFTVFIVIPVVFGIWVSLHNWDPLLPVKPFVGLQNYLDLITPGSTTFGPFWNSMEATGKFTLYSVPLLVVIPLLIALMLNREFRGRNFFRTMYFAPYVLGVAVIGILWRYLLDTNVGLVNYYLGQLGLPHNIPWTNELPWGWVALVGPTVWWTLGFNTVIILASANVFGQAYLITEGAPGDETQSAIMYIAEEGLRNFKMGSAAAMSYVLALFLAVISVGNFALFRYRED